ncbi:hypothetical protein IGI04_002848 [Brassica rapa subsp. trilocularis]|uniref:Uncharacterized protein n=1 Tax=Brassica rapa subsp. trilocularis TaxID=1813537 RepID=A0ABQ7NYS1_BRACM|nr:hypothetical protein IGI04_002848 [Brassica rapa subsp. trilocularis]
MMNIQAWASSVKLKTPNYSLWVRMMKKNPRGKGVWSHTSDEAPWKICKVFAHVNERQPEAHQQKPQSFSGFLSDPLVVYEPRRPGGQEGIQGRALQTGLNTQGKGVGTQDVTIRPEAATGKGI